MCQAYEAERNFIIAGEHRSTIKGFIAARERQPKSANPHGAFNKYDREAWDHGWECWRQCILPFALELQLKNRLEIAHKIRDAFKKKRQLSKELMAYLETFY